MSTPGQLHLLPQHAALLTASAISDEVARTRGYRSVEQKARLTELGFSSMQARVPALLIPVWDVHGETVLYQIRPDIPRIADGRVVKYETPRGARMALDVPPSVRSMLGDPGIPLFITEGIRKADAAASIGLCCIALLGVWNWRGSNEQGGKVALADWESIALHDRVVHIAFDSDVMVKPDVDAALGRLSALIERRGAQVRYIYLPSGPAGTKVGLDDFLAAGNGVDDVVALATDERRRPPWADPEDRRADEAAHGGARSQHSTAAGADAVPLAEALGAGERLLRHYVVLARHEAYLAVTLWVAHTHFMDAADATPYLAIGSPEKQSGKTRLLELLRYLAHAAPGVLIMPTAATLYRSLDATPGATLLLDELDAVFRDRSDRYEEVRAVINAGHRRGATVPRSVPGPKNTWVVKQFEVFGPKALAGIGRLPDTVVDRSISIRMVRRKRTESVKRWRERVGRPEAEAIVATLRASLAAMPPALTAEVPEALPDRAADAWEPLLAIADAAGGEWPGQARRAALVLQPSPGQDESLGLRLLADIRLIFDRRGVERIATTDLIETLLADDEGPWASHKSPLTPHRLSRLLTPFEITSKQMRIAERNLKGYEREAFLDSWERFLGDRPSPVEAKHRNAEHEPGFDVSVATPMEDSTYAHQSDLPVEDFYPRSAWDPDYDEHVGAVLQ
ncbi:hypothetical protein BH23CHL8_BH23CHL8_28820 [soil metagenome]